jgi:predicted nucleotidyltransferase component of viral defense system
MIPAQNIIAWSNVAPWAEPRQVEQDLIIARALVQLFSDSFLHGQLRFRGGTALNKLHFPQPLRYSEDIDLARTKEGASKPIWDRVHDLLDPWLGVPEYFRSQVAPALRYSVAAEDGTGTIRLKIEINEVGLPEAQRAENCRHVRRVRKAKADSSVGSRKTYV